MISRLGAFFINIILLPFSMTWSFVYRVRRFSYNYGIFKKNKFKVPIISVGNLSFGGTGKTPFTLWLSKFLIENEKKVMILTRGYKGKLEHGSGFIKTGAKLGYNPLEYGDEALIFARRLTNSSIVVGKKRSENLDYYFDKENPDVVVLDDGHQHLKLARNLNIVLFDSLMSLDKYKVAPLGYLREGMTSLSDADLVILGRVDQVSKYKINTLKDMILKYNPSVSFAEIRYLPTGFYSTNYEKMFEVEYLKGRQVICIAGIASPLSFFQSIALLGIDIIHQESFPDHYNFKLEDITPLLKIAEERNAYILTTEKDIVKIKRITDSDRVLYMEIKIDFVDGEEMAKKVISSSLHS